MLAAAAYGTPMARESSGERSGPTESPADLHAHAIENLRFIRKTMESAGSFTAVSGLGQVLIGASAIVAAVIASRDRVAAHWLGVWLIEGTLALLVGAWFIRGKAKVTGLALNSGVSRKFLICFAPPLLAGALLTGVLYGAGEIRLLPGTWLLMFGVAVVTGGAQSVRIVPFMGAAFMLLGAAALVAPARFGDFFMAAGFGGLLIGFGAVIARRHGG